MTMVFPRPDPGTITTCFLLCSLFEALATQLGVKNRPHLFLIRQLRLPTFRLFLPHDSAGHHSCFGGARPFLCVDQTGNRPPPPVYSATRSQTDRGWSDGGLPSHRKLTLPSLLFRGGDSLVERHPRSVFFLFCLARGLFPFFHTFPHNYTAPLPSTIGEFFCW